MNEYEVSFEIFAGKSNVREIIKGSSIVLNEQTGTAPVFAIINSKKLKLRAGQPVNMDFNKLEFETTEDQIIDVRFGIEGGKVSPAQATSIEISGGSLTVAGGSVRSKTSSSTNGTLPDISCPAGALTPLLTAEATRSFYVLRRTDAVTGVVRVGDANVGATRGDPKAKDEGVAGDSPDALYVWNPLASPVTFSVYKEYSS